MKGKLVRIVWLAPLLLGLAACSDDESITGAADTVSWNVETQADTTAESPFVFLEITVARRRQLR